MHSGKAGILPVAEPFAAYSEHRCLKGKRFPGFQTSSRVVGPGCLGGEVPYGILIGGGWVCFFGQDQSGVDAPLCRAHSKRPSFFGRAATDRCRVEQGSRTGAIWAGFRTIRFPFLNGCEGALGARQNSSNRCFHWLIWKKYLPSKHHVG